MFMNKIPLITTLSLALSPFIIGALMFSVQKQDVLYQTHEEKVYVAIEAEGRIGVIDTQKRKLIRSIDLSEVQNNIFVKYTTHNVQVAPNGKVVLVTANVDRGVMGEKASAEEDVSDGLSDKIFFIDPLTDTISDSFPIAVDAHLAHVVVNNTGTLAYAVSQEKDTLYVIDVTDKKILKTVSFEEGSEPHGLRLSPDNTKLFVALIGGKAIAEVDIANDSIRSYPVSGAVIQTAVTPDSGYVFGSVYEAKKVAWINTRTGERGYIDLPNDAQGSVQLYPTPDSKYLYVVNQGYYFDQPTGHTVYRIDVDLKKVDRTIPVGDAPHGIVVDTSGQVAYVTNLLSNDVSLIDTETNTEVARLKVGEMPNGISLWNQTMGGTP